MWRGPVERAHEVLLGGAELVERDDPAAAAPLLVAATVTRAMAGDCTADLALARRAARAAARTGDDAAVAGADALLATGLLLVGDRRRAPPFLEPIERLAPELDPLAPEYEMALFAAFTTALLGKAEESLTAIERLVEAARRTAAVAHLPYALFVRAEIDFRLGRWPQAMAAADESVLLLGELGSPVLECRALATRAMVAAGLGRDAPVQDDARRAIELAEAEGIGSMVSTATWVLGFAALAGGRPEEAVDHLEAVGRRTEAHGLREPSVVPWQPDLVEAYARLGDVSDARRVLALLSERAHVTGGAWAIAATCRCRGLIDDDLDRHFGEALAWHERDRMPFEQARTELAYGSRLRRAGRRTEARARLERALGTFEDLGAAQWARQAREEIAASGARLRPRRAGRPDDALSPRELQVATAVAEGLTNREVAARLFLSEKTVERHLGSVYRRLGLRSRTELARRFAARDAETATPPPPDGARA
jgi:DNA-binding CsgD family transcriptional regulator